MRIRSRPAVRKLEEVLEDWLLIRLRKDMPIPELNGISLEVHAIA